jgi:hypothetical protein
MSAPIGTAVGTTTTIHLHPLVGLPFTATVAGALVGFVADAALGATSALAATVAAVCLHTVADPPLSTIIVNAFIGTSTGVIATLFDLVATRATLVRPQVRAIVSNIASTTPTTDLDMDNTPWSSFFDLFIGGAPYWSSFQDPYIGGVLY